MEILEIAQSIRENLDSILVEPIAESIGERNEYVRLYLIFIT